MTNEMSLAHEFREHSLCRRRCIQTRCCASGGKCRDERAGDDHVRQSHSREQHLAECAHVNHAPIVVDPLKSLQRPSSISKLSDVIVLDYPGANLGGVINQLRATLWSHCHAKRELMRRSDANE